MRPGGRAVRRDAPVHTGSADVRDDESIDQAKQAVASKYGWQATRARAADSVRARIGRGDTPVAIRIRLDHDS